ncbi:hypothetical protein [Metapseudomonas otitidis]|uniref:hypothetical protein n=1 Tax=Metapseudomonas otitidis TaxID=319939 RepID=UPI00244C2F85|nr:hypothetical protein [Pseudomonas otitidis]MDG9785254.1 hypothetical protein [Pseudomonas otitidis]
MDDNLIERRRPAFEAWALANMNFRNPIARWQQGDYVHPSTHVAWDAWNAALDSPVVELPGDDGMDGHLWGPDVVDAIERAGLRVKS